MTMQAWRRLYELWRQYGLSKAAFYQFIDGEMPSLWCMYDRFHRIQPASRQKITQSPETK